jgi:hypothetical protein
MLAPPTCSSEWRIVMASPCRVVPPPCTVLPTMPITAEPGTGRYFTSWPAPQIRRVGPPKIGRRVSTDAVW